MSDRLVGEGRVVARVRRVMTSEDRIAGRAGRRRATGFSAILVVDD